jgi:hypothetical protein
LLGLAFNHQSHFHKHPIKMEFLIHRAYSSLSIDITLGEVNLTRLLPPGPPGTPILCHLRLIPRDHPEGAFTLWGEQYKADILEEVRDAIKFIAYSPDG